MEIANIQINEKLQDICQNPTPAFEIIWFSDLLYFSDSNLGLFCTTDDSEQSENSESTTKSQKLPNPENLTEVMGSGQLSQDAPADKQSPEPSGGQYENHKQEVDPNVPSEVELVNENKESNDDDDESRSSEKGGESLKVIFTPLSRLILGIHY